MHYQALRRTINFIGILLFSWFSIGCMSVVTPVPPSDATMVDESHGLLLGTVHLTPNERVLSPIYMKWWIEEETRGTHILLTNLPVDIPFAVRLPAGSYRITEASFHTGLGVWLTDLSTTFKVLPRECTSLGSWNLDPQHGFLTALLTRQVTGDQAGAQDKLGETSETQGCPTIVASLNPDGKQSMRLTLRTRGDFDRP
jgi:hypothetical protein